MLPRFATCAGLMLFALATVPASASAADRTADRILQEIEAVKLPGFDRAKADDAKAIEEYTEALDRARKRRGELVLELFRVDPENDRLPKLFAERWLSMRASGPKADELVKEIDEVAAGTKNEKLRAEAAITKVYFQLYQGPAKTAELLAAVDDFAKKFPKDERTGQLLYGVASRMEDKAKRAEVEDRLIKDYPDSPYAGMLTGARRRREAIGKPFELDFADALSGKRITMDGLKGKVVVIDFWATWCGPCVGEMPNMKKLYSEYKDKGVEFIGVSLDQPEEDGGLKALKEFVEKNEVPWPQYYQGKGWEGAFSSGWGINSIPAVFVVDPKGNLHSVEARGKLEEMIPELLKTRGD